MLRNGWRGHEETNVILLVSTLYIFVLVFFATVVNTVVNTHFRRINQG